ncbi:MAG: adenylate/guanylate cyclase domain-containing protein [Candidatus Solibacter sp.]
MLCSNCGTDNSTRVKFCSECGSPMGIPCPECDFRNARDAATCGDCGRSLQAVVPIAERRQLTVFFADIVGSTSLSEQLDPEDLHDLYARYQTLCAKVVEYYGGHIAQYLGDGVLAYFGYPAAHEDDAQRAVRSGLDLLRGVNSIALNGIRPQIRIGIHTGLVVVGDVGAGFRREQLALGEAPNIAARLQSEAQPDSMVISHATRALLGGQFALENQGSRTLKGLSRPMQIFRVLGMSTATTRFEARTSVHGLTRFVGREREADLIRTAWQAAVDGRGQTLLLTGEAGIGKSRLLAAAREIAGKRLYELFEAECSPYQMNNPLNPVVEMLARRIGTDEEAAPAAKLELVELFAAGRGVPVEEATVLLAEVLSVATLGRYGDPGIPPARRRQRTIEILAALLLHAVGGSPVLLLIEDLHWADPSTLDLLGLILATQSELPVLVIATARPEFSVGWSQPWFRQIRVEKLAPADTRTLVAGVAGSKPLPPALVEELVARTGGIPLFVEAVTRSIMESGILRELEDRFELTGPLPAGLIPATVQDSLMGRIDRLGSDRAVAQLAATIGRESSFELLQTVLGKSTAELTQALKHLVDLDLVAETGTHPASTYTFKHALIQDAAYESLLRKTRQEFHGKIAEVLVHRFPEMAETRPELLARHFEGAGRIAEAIAGWVKAGLRAQQSSAVRECVAYLQKAILLCKTLPEDDSDRLQAEMNAQEALSGALTVAMGWGAPEVESACIRAGELCRQLGNAGGYVRSMMGLSTLYLMRGNPRQALRAVDEVMHSGMAAGIPDLDAGALTPVLLGRYFMADFPATCDIAVKALANYSLEAERIVAALYHSPPSFACANFRAMSHWFMGFPEEAAKQGTDAWQMIEDLNLPSCTAYGLGCQCTLLVARRELDQLLAVSTRLSEIASDQGFLLWSAIGAVYHGYAIALAGNLEAGMAEMKGGLSIHHLTGSGLLTPLFSCMMAEVCVRAGLVDDALAALSRGMRHCDEFGELVFEPELYRLHGEILASRGDAVGETSLRKAIERAQAQQAKTLELRAALSLARLQLAQGRRQDAHELLMPLEAWFQKGQSLPELTEARAILSA